MTCKTCITCNKRKPEAAFERVMARGKSHARNSCRDCRRAYTTAALAKSRAKARSERPEAEVGPVPFVPPADFLLMGPAANAPLVWTIGRAAA